MKKFLSILIIAALSVGSFTACKTTSNPTGIVTIGSTAIDPAAVQVTIRIAAKLGTVATLNADTNSRPYFAIAANVIDAAILAGDYNPTNVVASIDKLTGNALVSASIADALQLYQVFFSQVATNAMVDKSPYTIPALTGLANGIYDGLALSPAKYGAYKPIAPTKLK